MLLAKDIFSDEQCYTNPTIGLSAKDCRRYSLARVYRSLERNEQPHDGLELEASQEVAKRGGGLFTGFSVPFDVLADRGQRDMTVGTFGQGGAFVQTAVDSSPIELLRNAISALRLGATVLTGLRGNLALPRQTGAATVSGLSEIAQAQVSNQTIDQPILTPKRVAAKLVYSRQLLIQSSPSVEMWLREDLFAQFALKLDYFIYNGAGGNSEPLGIINTPGIGSVIFGGAASWGTILNFEANLANANAEVLGAKISFVTTPSCRNKWKQTAQALIGATTVSAKPIWETGKWNDATNDGLVNGYRAAVTQQVLNNGVFCGNFKEVVLGMWGDGISLINDQFTRADQGEIVITGNAYADVTLRHPQSFCVSADSGAQ
jgi:HK97 family phage major capsid protein